MRYIVVLFLTTIINISQKHTIPNGSLFMYMYIQSVCVYLLIINICNDVRNRLGVAENPV